MRVADRFLRFLVVLALAFAVPALASAPARAGVAAQHHEPAGKAIHAGHAVQAKAALHDCGDATSGSSAHHATPDCLICCCALATVLAPPDISRAAIRLETAERAQAFDSLNLPPPAPPPRG